MGGCVDLTCIFGSESESVFRSCFLQSDVLCLVGLILKVMAHHRLLSKLILANYCADHGDFLVTLKKKEKKCMYETCRKSSSLHYLFFW